MAYRRRRRAAPHPFFRFLGACGWLAALPRMLESLESRVLLSAISWTGNAGDNLWTTPGNWSGNAVPGAADDVTISVGGNPTIVIPAGNQSIHGLTSDNVINLTGGTLAVQTASLTANLVLTNGYVAGGVFTFSGGGELLPVPNSSTNQNSVITLDGVTLNGLLDMAQGGTLFVHNGLTLNGTAELGNASINFQDANQTLSGTGTINLLNAPYQVLDATHMSGTLTIGPGITILGGNTFGSFIGTWLGAHLFEEGTVTDTIINYGTIDATIPGGALYLSGNIINHGVIEADGGQVYIQTVVGGAGSLSLTSPGSGITLGDGTNGTSYTLDQPVILATGASLTLDGTLPLNSLSNITASGGVVNLTGTLTGTGTSATLNGGTLQLLGGTILGGTLTLANNATLAVSDTTHTNTLSAVILDGNIDMASTLGASLHVNSGLTLNGTLTLGTGAALSFDGTQTLNGNGTVSFADAASNRILLNASGMTLTIGPNITIRGGSIPGAGGLPFPTTYIECDLSNTPNVSIINQGAIIADTGVILMQITGTFTNQGAFEAINDSSLFINANVAIDGAAVFSESSGGSLIVAGNLTGATTNPNLFNLPGTTSISRFGSNAANPVLLEAMSQDLGATASVASNSFAFGTLNISDYVKLVDQSDNSAGTGSEAIYVNTLIVPEGATLDLNGLHVYARNVEIGNTYSDGIILNGTVTQLADTSPILPGAPTAGTISAPGELDEWTFTGQAGHLLNIQLDPGSGGSSIPGAPYLVWGKVQLVGPTGTILATVNSTIQNAVLSLDQIALPADGTYTIRVRAGDGAIWNTGDYVISASDVTPPGSSVDLLPAFSPGSFSVVWAGTDNSGSGLASLDIYVSDNGGAFTPWITGTTDTEATYDGEDGHTYGFYSIAHDNDGNTQATPSGAQASTKVDSLPPTSALDALPAVETGPFTVSWSGSDAGGSGVASYDVYVSDNGGDFAPYLTDTALTSASFTGVNLHSYVFSVVAHDAVGNVQVASSNSNVSILVNLAFGQPLKLAFESQPTHVLAGSTLADAVVVGVEDSLGNLLATQNASITLSIASGPSGGILQGTLTAQSQNGEATFDGLSFSKAGTYILRASGSGAAAGQTAAITVSLPPTHLGFSVQPGSTIAGHVIGPVISVSVLDASNHVVSLDHSTVSIALSGAPAGTLSGTTSVQAVNGVAVFNDLSLVDADSYTLAASDGALTGAKSKAFTITAETASSHLVLLTQPAETLVGKALSPVLTLAVEDQFGNVVLTDHSKVGLSVVSGPGGLAGTVLVTAGKGIATFSKATLTAAGDYTLSATDSSLAIATPIQFSVTIDPGITTVAAPKPAASSVFGKAISLSATFKATSPGTVPFTGTAGIFDSTQTLLGIGTLTASGSVKFMLDDIAPGSYVASISYPGDGAHTAATSSTFTLQINPSPTSIALVASAATLVFGQSLTLTAAVNSSSAPDVARTGSVSFYDGQVLLGTVALGGSSSASLTLDPGIVGKHAFKAIYSGDGNFTGGSSSSLVRSVGKAKSSIVLTSSSASPVSLNQTFNAAIHVAVIAPGAAMLAGDSVVIKDNGKVVATLNMDSNGDAVLPGLSYTAAGTHTLVAIFGGDDDLLAVTSAGLKLAVA